MIYSLSFLYEMFALFLDSLATFNFPNLHSIALVSSKLVRILSQIFLSLVPYKNTPNKTTFLKNLTIYFFPLSNPAGRKVPSFPLSHN